VNEKQWLASCPKYTVKLRICHKLENGNESKNLPLNDRLRGHPSRIGGNPMEIRDLLIIIIVLMILRSIWLFYVEYLLMKNKVNALDERLQKLEATTTKRMPFLSQEEILNAMAAIDVLLTEFHFGTDVIENAKAHLIKSLTVGTKREK
jgi:hypothetical protein